METESWVDGILNHRFEMAPLATSVEPKLLQLTGIKAVVFDIYGTLVISGSGDVGSADTCGRDSFVHQTLEEFGILKQLAAIPDAETLQRKILQLNKERAGSDCPKPEVDIVEVWRHVLAEAGWLGRPTEIEVVVKVATRYEALANPTWPMPGAIQLLQQLKRVSLPMGIVSNAQVFTPCLVNNLLGQIGLEEGGFNLDLCVFSNRYRQAKPGPRVFKVLRQSLSSHGILPDEAVYVGNDMLNDVWAASEAGLRTAWFAGDQRSCRPRQDDVRCQGLSPDLVLTSLMQLPECLLIS
jgi:putative hydrolase of the HAD superfamily